MNNKRKEKSEGITLISLVITIIILIILSSIGIYLSLENNGVFTRTKQAKEVTNKQTATEIINLKITTVQMNKYAEKQEMPTLQELADILYEDNEIQYVALESKVADKEKVTVGNKTSIFTKLNQYPYEFEINSSLQLASIDGIKVANNKTENVISDNILYDITNYSSEEIKIYEDRFKNIQGGYMIQGNMVYVYIVALTNKSPNWAGKYTAFTDLPKAIELEPLQITESGGRAVSANINQEGKINIVVNSIIPDNEKVVFRGKYKIAK